MNSHNRFPALALIISLAGCSADSNPPAAPLEPESPALPVDQDRVTRIQLNVDSIFIVGRIRQELSVYPFDARLRLVANKLVVWSSSDTSVVTVDREGNCGFTATPGCYSTSVYARGDGNAVITATVDGVAAKLPVRARLALADASGIDVDFSVIELSGDFDAPFIPEIWFESATGPFYAPLITVTETTGKRAIEIVGFSIRIPPSTWDFRCTGSLKVGSGKAMPMFPSFYGAYHLIIIGKATKASDEVLATVYLSDESGTVTMEEVIGKIVRLRTDPPAPSEWPSWKCV